MRPDCEAIAKGSGLTCDQVHTHLCRAQAAVAANALKSGEQVIVACGQEAPAFLELANELEATDRLLCVDIRDRAGWSDDPAGPKMAALIAEARLATPALPLMDVESEGLCLLYGSGDMAVEAATRLAATLSVTCMLPEPAGRITNATGALGQFALEIDGFAELAPAGRGPRAFADPQDGAKSDCDLIVDLSGGPARRPGRSAGGRARAVRRRPTGRHLRETAAYPLRRGALRPQPRRAHRLHPLPRPLPHRRDHA
jgi:hypothetical protein